MKILIIVFLTIISWSTTVVAADSSQTIYRGLSLEAGHIADWSSYPYEKSMYYQEIITYHGLRTYHQFGKSEGRLLMSGGLELALGYEVTDWCFSFGLTAVAFKAVDIYSYHWTDPNLPCINIGINTGCELAKINTDYRWLYRLGAEYNVWRTFYLKWQTGLSDWRLYQSREAYGKSDPKVEKTLYQQTVWTNDLLLRWTTADPQSSLRFIVEAGWGYAHGQLLESNNRFFFGLKLNGHIWSL
ncbi:MAG: hypothetical protein V1765_02945 [bacterium]